MKIDTLLVYQILDIFDEWKKLYPEQYQNPWYQRVHKRLAEVVEKHEAEHEEEFEEKKVE